MDGYFVEDGYMGLVDCEYYILFASESDYYDYIKEHCYETESDC